MHANSARPLGVGTAISSATRPFATVRPPGSPHEDAASAGSVAPAAAAIVSTKMASLRFNVSSSGKTNY
jgi:hypothetical protein